MPKRIILPIVYFLLFFSCFLSAQNFEEPLKAIWINANNSDSLRFKVINDYCKKFSFEDPDDVLPLTDYHYQLAEEKNNEIEMANALNNRALAYYIKDNSEKSMELLLRALDILKQYDSPIEVAKQNNNIGSIYRNQNNYQKAIQYYNFSLDIFKTNNVKNNQADVLNNIGLVYYDINNYEFALKYLFQALKLYKQLNLQDKIGNIWLNIGSVYYEEGKYEDAITYGQKALRILELNNNIFSASDCYRLFAKTNQKLNKNKVALQNAEKSLALNKKIGNESKILADNILIADLTFETNLDKATKIVEDVQEKITPDTDLSIKVDLYNLLYKCYKANRNFGLSLSMYEKYVIYNDSLKIKKNNLAIAREAIQKEYDSKLEQSKMRQDRKTYSIVAISILLILIILIYTRSTLRANRKKRNVLLEEIEQLKKQESNTNSLGSNRFELNRIAIENSLNRKINDTDWTVLTILVDDPVISNKDIAEKAFMSIDGIGSSLRRMYDYFEIKDSKYKKISLLMEAIKHSSTKG